jgi:hypothetical protein
LEKGASNEPARGVTTGGPIGVPYRSIARLILLYLRTEAVRSDWPKGEHGRLLMSWMGRITPTTGARPISVTGQARRIRLQTNLLR